MTLPQPTAAQVKASCQLHQCLPQWKWADSSLALLRKTLPHFGADECLLKTVTVNALYGTRILALIRMADHVCKTMAKWETTPRGPELVEELARMPQLSGKRPRKYISFASKFCHFFVDSERFPIYDDAVCRMVQLHLGRKRNQNADAPYLALIENLQTLRERAGITCPPRDLDRYLWIAGMFAKSRKSEEVNVELSAMFNNPLPAAAALLKVALPAGWWPPTRS